MTDRSPPVPPPPSPDQKVRRRREPWAWIIPIITFLVGVGVGAMGAPDDDDPPTAASPVSSAAETSPTLSSPSPEASPTPSPLPTPELKPAKGTWTPTACDLQLFTQGFDTSTLVGAVELENTGDLPGEVTVSMKWDALPGPRIDGGEKVITLQPGRTREVRFQENIPGDDVDPVQSSPGYEGTNDEKFCIVKARIE